jgi:hypothetical protein
MALTIAVLGLADLLYLQIAATVSLCSGRFRV